MYRVPFTVYHRIQNIECISNAWSGLLIQFLIISSIFANHITFSFHRTHATQKGNALQTQGTFSLHGNAHLKSKKKNCIIPPTHVVGLTHTQSVLLKMQQTLGSLLTHLQVRHSASKHSKLPADSHPKQSGNVRKQLCITQHIALSISNEMEKIIRVHDHKLEWQDWTQHKIYFTYQHGMSSLV